MGAQKKEIKKKAIKYAKGCELSVLEQALANAYIEGYNAAVEDMEAENNIEYVDLGLPSGTLWSNKYISDVDTRWIVYDEAKRLHLPTKSQVEELFAETRVTYDKTGISLLSSNGKSLFIPRNAELINEPKSPLVSFWIRSDYNDKKEAEHFAFILSSKKFEPWYVWKFIGECSGALSVKFK